MKKIKINGQDFEIEANPDINAAGAHGAKFAYNSKIQIATHLVGLERLSTIWHEVLHHACRFSGMSHKFSLKDEEYICDAFSYAIASIQLQNPDLMDLVEKEEFYKDKE